MVVWHAVRFLGLLCQIKNRFMTNKHGGMACSSSRNMVVWRAVRFFSWVMASKHGGMACSS
ncbi:hypothetical protein BMR04_13940 [Methylococcaceae bacterium HT3]|nr:hypothetical protein BMR04_13940 [Methylococcaceae bacterium HT3]